jgi:hypothetical protein
MYGECLKEIKNTDIRRLARRAGVKRISILTYDEIRKSLKTFLKDIVGHDCIFRVLQTKDCGGNGRSSCIKKSWKDHLRLRWINFTKSKILNLFY